jgi:hypothetical protein
MFLLRGSARSEFLSIVFDFSVQHYSDPLGLFLLQLLCLNPSQAIIGVCA